MRRTTKWVLAAAAALGLAGPGIRAGSSSEPWIDAPPFSLSASVLHSKVTELAVPDDPAEVLLEDMRITVDTDHRETREFHGLYRVLTAAGVESRGTLGIIWAPWTHARPLLRARVISPDGIEHVLDAATISEAAIGSDGEVFSDRRQLEAPLPAMSPGAIVEFVWRLEGTSVPLFPAASGRYMFGDSVPVRHTRVVIESPRKLVVATRTFLAPTVTSDRVEDGDVVRTTLESGPMPKNPEYEAFAPFDVAQWPSVAYSTGASWSEIASAYAAIVDRQIAGSHVAARARAAVKGTASRRRQIEAIVRALHHDVRYTGIEFGEAELVPAKPDQTMKRRYGDCKDKSALLVAMLRDVGIGAHVALVDSGLDAEMAADIVGIDAFDHAIVQIPGEPELWVDATAEHHRVGDLPVGVSGRLALVASDATTGLRRIPDATSAGNRREHANDYYIAESGLSRIVETNLGSGTLEAELRDFYATFSDTELRKQFEPAVKSAMKAASLGMLKKTDSNDLTRPFELVIEGIDSKAGAVGASASIVRSPASEFVSRLREALPPLGEGAKGDTRTAPFRLSAPFTDVWVTRVHPPPGFVPGEAPLVEETHIGPVTFTRTFETLPDGTLEFRAVVDTGSRLVWTTRELADVRAWVEKMGKADDVQIVVEQLAFKLLREGKTQDAVHEYQKLVALHPKEALHHYQLAEAYLSGGVGEAARREGRRAVELDPKSTEAWTDLGYIYASDMFGRPFAKGSDLAESERALRQALELDPKQAIARKNLAVLLEYDPTSMIRYGKRARLKEATEEWRTLRAGADTAEYDVSYFASMARAGRWNELLEAAREPSAAKERPSWIVLASAMVSGTDAAIAEAGRQTTSRSERDRLLATAASGLFALRRYSESAGLLRASSLEASGGAAASGNVGLLARCRRHEDHPPEGQAPQQVVERFLLASLLEDDPQRFGKLVSTTQTGAPSGDELRKIRKSLTTTLGAFDDSGITLDGIADVMLAVFDWRAEGTDSTGYRVKSMSAVPGQSQSMTMYLVPEDGQLKVTGLDPSALGAVALRWLTAGREDDARTWLAWAAEAMPPAHADPLADAPFLAFWPADPAKGGPALELAAAALAAGGPSAAGSPKVLNAASAAASSDDERFRIDYALLSAYVQLDRQADALDASRRLLAAKPQSDSAFDFVAMGLLGTLSYDELGKLCAEREATKPADALAWRIRSRLASAQRDWDASIRARREVVALGKAWEADFNALAWEALFLGKDGTQAIEDAEHAALFAKQPSWASLHTLAAVYADAGRVADARQALLKAITARGTNEIESADWVVIGRLAEQYGAIPEALAAYARVEKPDRAPNVPGSSFELARMWAARAGAPAGPAAPSAKATGKARGL